MPHLYLFSCSLEASSVLAWSYCSCLLCAFLHLISICFIYNYLSHTKYIHGFCVFKTCIIFTPCKNKSINLTLAYQTLYNTGENQPTSLGFGFHPSHTETLTLSSWHALLWCVLARPDFLLYALSYLLISFTIQVTAQPVFLRKLCQTPTFITSHELL